MNCENKNIFVKSPAYRYTIEVVACNNSDYWLYKLEKNSIAHYLVIYLLPMSCHNEKCLFPPKHVVPPIFNFCFSC